MAAFFGEITIFMGRLFNSAITYAKLHKDIVFEMELGNNIDGIKKVVLNFPSENSLYPVRQG